MDFILLPDLAAFMIGFVAIAAVSVALAIGTTVLFFADNHTLRVRRHESVRHYYGHLAFGR